MNTDSKLARSSGTSRQIALLAVCSVASLLLLSTASAQDSEPSQLTHARQATVFLMQAYQQGGNQSLSCVGSGTLISADGLIVTNLHLVSDTGPCRGEQLIVSLPVRLDEPPVPTYLAHVVQSDELLDLAVLQITSGLDGSSMNKSSMNLPYVTPGDPSGITVGTSLNFVGFPDATSSSAVTVAGAISGVVTDKGGRKGSFLQPQTPLSGAMSGGGAYDAGGHLIGILTGAAATDGITPGTACVNIQDNNHDGRIDEHDNCVPIGSPVTLVRPIAFAQALIAAAQNGFSLDRSSGLPSTVPKTPARINRVYFSLGVSDAGAPSQIVSTIPSGSKSLFMFFDYHDMRPGTPYEVRAAVNGIPVAALSIGPLAWGGGPDGTWYVGAEDTILVDGAYEFTVLLSGQVATSQTINVGGSTSEPEFSNLTFVPSNGQGTIAPAGIVFPAATIQIVAQFSYSNVPQGQDWTEVWYLDGSEIFRTTRIWDKPASGQLSVSATNLGGLPLGRYRLELYIGSRLAATGDLTLAGNRNAQGGSVIFSNPRIATDKTRDGLPSGLTGPTLPLGVTSIYAFIDWDFMPAGTMWTYRWFLDGRLVASSTQSWDAGAVGQNYWIRLFSGTQLPEGTYALDVLVQDSPMFSYRVALGSGTRALSGQGTSVETVAISGTVSDALTGQGIEDALIAVLNVKLTSAQFTWNEADIYSEAISDQEGHFVLSKPLPKGNYYTVYAFADGYTTMVEDFFTVLSTQSSPVEISINLNRP